MPRFIPPHPTKGSPEAFAWAKRMREARLKRAAIRHAGLRTERKFFSPRGIFAKAGHRAHLNPRRITRNLVRVCMVCKKRMGEKPPYGDTSETHGICETCYEKELAKQRNNGRSIPCEREHRKNPLAVFGLGNPPKRINSSVAGVLYSRCLEIRAEKTKFKPGLYKHPFSQKAGVQILALDNGDLLVHSTRGVNLWKPV